MYDVAVVGAGPSGSYVAYLLANEGFNVVLLERRNLNTSENTLCAGIVSKEAFRRLSLPENTILKGIKSFRFISPSGETFRYEHHCTFAYVVDRTAFDLALLSQAQKKGVSFLQGLVEEIKINNDYVELSYRDTSRNLVRLTLRAKVSVIAAGLNTSLLNKSGLKRPEGVLMGAQIEAGFTCADEVEVYLGNNIAPGSFAWVIPISDSKARIGLTVNGDAMFYLKSFLEIPQIKERLNDRPEIKCRPIPFGPSSKTYGSRILSVGDAAGQVKTTTGGGIYYGLIGAEIAAQTLKEAFKKNDFSHSSLMVYEKRWRKRLDTEILMGIKLRKIYATLTDKTIDNLIRVANSSSIVSLIKKARFDWQRGFFLSLLRKPIIKDLLGVQ